VLGCPQGGKGRSEGACEKVMGGRLGRLGWAGRLLGYLMFLGSCCPGAALTQEQ